MLAIAAVVLAGCGLAVAWAANRPTLEERRREASATARSRAEPHRGRSGDRVRPVHASSGASGEYTHHDWSQESDLGRSMALDLPGPSFWTDADARGGPDRDPQLDAMWRSFRFAPQDERGERELPFEPTAQRATLLEAEGELAGGATSCAVRVLPVAANAFNCVLRVMCDGEILYPDPRQRAGYVPCEIENGRPVRAVDDGHSSRDGDPLVSFDVHSGTVTVEDFLPSGERRYRATLRLDG